MKAWLRPMSYERRYGRFLGKTVEQVRREFLARLGHVIRLKTLTYEEEFANDVFFSRAKTVSDNSDEVAVLIGSLLLWWQAQRLLITPNIRGYFSIVNSFNDNQFRTIIKDMTGVTLSPSVYVSNNSNQLITPIQEALAKFGDTADVFRQEPYLEGIEKNWVAAQETYADTVVTNAIKESEIIVRNGLVTAVDAAATLAAINKKFETVDKRVNNGGADNINKLDAILAQKRQQSLGANEYIWETRRDERVRGNPNGLYPNAKPSHFAREGVVFNWNNPPEGGAPGEAPGCRCRAVLKLPR